MYNEGGEWEVVEVPELEQEMENLSGGDNIKSPTRASFVSQPSAK
jgi:hypothetical protein